MSLLEHFDHPNKKQDKEHFRHLVQIALADGTIGDLELKMLYRLGKNKGFTDPEIEDLIKVSIESDYHPPYELSKRFEQLYSIVKMVMADGIVDESELRLAKALALKSGFTDGEIPALLTLLIDGIKDGVDDDDLFAQYRKRIMTLK